MYVKIPTGLGNRNINLTMEYLLEDVEDITKLNNEEETATVHLLVSRIYFLLIIKMYKWLSENWH